MPDGRILFFERYNQKTKCVAYIGNETYVHAHCPQFSASNLAHMFPHSGSAAKRKIQELRARVFQIQDMERYYFPKDPVLEFKINFILRDHEIAVKMGHIEFLEKYIRLCKRAKTERGKLDILRAKQVPISSWIEFNRAGFASCFLHKDATPSLKYYEKENKVHCFSCGFRGDVIDVVMKIRECSFIDAVKILL